ncbi:MAG: helix-turn-helix transcriptional regulator [Ruminococcus sp.]|nr:helix-turn-helix transcriptional regulator [Ruminococcus sp.]
MIYSKNLKELRERNGYTIADLAKIINVDKTGYGHYEREYVIIPIKHLVTLCDYFNISIDYIFNFTDLKQYNETRNGIDRNLTVLRLKEFRKENKLTQERLAKVINISSGTIAGYEIGRYLMATPFLYTICNKYNISADYLLGRIDSPKYLK